MTSSFAILCDVAISELARCTTKLDLLASAVETIEAEDEAVEAFHGIQKSHDSFDITLCIPKLHDAPVKFSTPSRRIRKWTLKPRVVSYQEVDENRSARPFPSPSSVTSWMPCGEIFKTPDTRVLSSPPVGKNKRAKSSDELKSLIGLECRFEDIISPCKRICSGENTKPE